MSLITPESLMWMNLAGACIPGCSRHGREWIPEMSVAISWGDKEALTVIAAITGARTRLPPCLIAAGKTSVFEKSHFGDIGYHHTKHSKIGLADRRDGYALAALAACHL
jgi:hypothetical protein